MRGGSCLQAAAFADRFDEAISESNATMIHSEEVYRFPDEMCQDENPWGDTIPRLPPQVKLGYIVSQCWGVKAVVGYALA
jgi:hypothetical protein